MAVAVGRAVMLWCNEVVNDMEEDWIKGRRELRREDSKGKINERVRERERERGREIHRKSSGVRIRERDGKSTR